MTAETEGARPQSSPASCRRSIARRIGAWLESPSGREIWLGFTRLVALGLAAYVSFEAGRAATCRCLPMWLM